MSKQKHFTVSVPKPCEEDWDKMTPAEQGRHCASCNTPVIDFSNYTDRELAAFLKSYKTGSSCGKFEAHQINRPIYLTEQSKRSFFQRFLYGSAVASWLGIATHAGAQAKAAQPTEQRQAGHTAKPQGKAPADTVCTVKGKVTDSHNSPLADAGIRVTTLDQVDEIAQTSTNDKGNYSIIIPKKYENQKLAIFISADGHPGKDESFILKESLIFNVKMEDDKETRHRGRHFMGKF